MAQCFDFLLVSQVSRQRSNFLLLGLGECLGILPKTFYVSDSCTKQVPSSFVIFRDWTLTNISLLQKAPGYDTMPDMTLNTEKEKVPICCLYQGHECEDPWKAYGTCANNRLPRNAQMVVDAESVQRLTIRVSVSNSAKISRVCSKIYGSLLRRILVRLKRYESTGKSLPAQQKIVNLRSRYFLASVQPSTPSERQSTLAKHFWHDC
jgi:hypothetical protein